MIPYAPFTPKQTEYIRRAQTSWLNVAEGGRRAGKNIINLIAWAAALDSHLHLCGGVSTSAVKMNIIDSNGFGLAYIFGERAHMGQYRGRDARTIQTSTGEKVVILAGGKKGDDAARIKGNSYGSVYVTEVNECHPTFMKECIDRTLASRRRQVFFDLNPKPPSHWFYKDFLDFQDELKRQGKNPGYNYGHFMVLDNQSLTNEQLRVELAKYGHNSLWFQSDILGLRTAASGRIYENYDPHTMILTPEQVGKLKLVDLAVGVDVGGTDATCATLLDGYPMAREGKPLKALDMALVASTFGGLVSALALLFFSPPISRIAMSFGAPEYFALALFGLSIIASVSGKSILKGLVSGALGMLLATVGVDSISGKSRFTFGSVMMYKGINMIAVLLGVYAIAQMISRVNGGGRKGQRH